MISFWRGKRVLVTGHTGFKGSWLALWLQQLGAEVTGLALPPPTRPSLFEDADVAEGMVSIEGDIRSLETVQRVFAESRPDIVLHLAAQALVRVSYAQPVETYATNVLGTVHVLEAARHTDSVRAMVIITSDKCYENREWDRAYREDEPMGGYDPYSSSKGCAELVTAAYRRSFFTDGRAAVASARAGNVIGGGDWAEDRLVPDIVKAFRAGRPVLIRHPRAIRPWQHVLEPLRGYLMLAEQLWTEGRTYAEAWNFGPGPASHQPVQTVVESFCQRWGGAVRWEPDPAAHPHEAHVLRLDNTKAQSRLGWHPLLDLAEALDLTVEWYRAWEPGRAMRALTLSQLHRFLERTTGP